MGLNSLIQIMEIYRVRQMYSIQLLGNFDIALRLIGDVTQKATHGPISANALNAIDTGKVSRNWSG